MSKTLIGIVTRNDQESFNKCLKSVTPIFRKNLGNFIINGANGTDVLPDTQILIVNDGTPYSHGVYDLKCPVIQHDRIKNNAACYNQILRHAVLNDYEHIFLLWDVMEVRDVDVFWKYIQTSLATNLPLLFYGLSAYPTATGMQPNSRAVINYTDKTGVTLNADTTSTLTYLRREVIDQVGYFDERYKSVLELGDYAYRASEKGLLPSWGWFPDIKDSNQYFNLNKSNDTQDLLRSRIMHAAALFMHKFTILPEKIPQLPIESVKESLKIMKDKKWDSE